LLINSLIQPNAPRTGEAQSYHLEIGSGSHFEVVLKLLPARTIVNEVNTGIDLLDSHPLIIRDTGLPARGVAADEVIGSRSQLTLSNYMSATVRTD